VSIIAREAAVSYHYTIKELPSSLRPRERLLAEGPGALRDDELVAIILKTGTAQENVAEVANGLVRRFETLQRLSLASRAELEKVSGVGPVKAAELMAAFELGRRARQPSREDQQQITTPRQVFDLLSERVSELDHERIVVLLLHQKHRVQRQVEVSRGTLSGATVRVAELFKEAVKDQAAAIVLTHNHPSGDPTPSDEDVVLTQRAVQIGDEMDIPVLDHVVIGKAAGGRDGWVSLRERGLGFGRS
jgi:DNA repair protein RadC